MVHRPGFSRREFLTASAGAFGATASTPTWCATMDPATDPHLRQVLAQTLAIDMHNHVYPAGISERNGFFSRSRDPLPTPTSAAAPMLAAEMERAGFTAVCASYELDFTPIAKPGDARDNYLRWMDALDRQLEREGLRRALTSQDLQAAHTARRQTIIHTVEGAQFIEGRLERIEEVYRRGLRHLQLLHDRDDLVARLGDTDNGRDHSGGLTATGRDVIRECNRLGILVDLAHGSPETILAATRIATRPFIVSHTGPAVSSGGGRMSMLQPRLLDSERARVVADAGGVIGLWIYSTDTVEQYVQNLRRMVGLAGVDHVGIGSDSNLLSPQPLKATNQVWRGLRTGFFLSVAAEMLRQGFAPDEIGKIGGGNYVRVFGAATAGGHA